MIRKLALTTGSLVLAASCTAAPTEPRAHGHEASYDGGTLGGSGNRGGTGTGGTGSADATTASTDSTNRGGTLGGSGN